MTMEMSSLTVGENTYEIVDEKARQEIEGLNKTLESSNAIRIGSVTLLADEWNGDVSPYSQVVDIEGVTENSQVDLTPSVEQLSVFWEKDIAFVTENTDGVVTVYCIGQKPLNDYTMQVTITEVAYE